MRQLALPVSLAVTAVVSATLTFLSARPSAGAGEVQAAAGTVTAVLSPRRAPEVFAQAVGETKLAAALDAILAEPAFASADVCLTVESGDDLVYARNPDAALVPASTMKVVTGMVALRRLGPGFRYETPLVIEGAVPPDGVVTGPAWLVGSGDPLLSTAGYASSFRNQPQVFTSLDAMADAIVARGIKEIRGGIVGDETRYDTVRYVPSWKAAYLSDNDVGPVSALSVNDGFTEYRPRRRQHAEDPARHAAATLTDLLRGRGVVVGEPSSGAAPAGGTPTRVAVATSPPLPEIVGELLRESDNMTAELLVKELGKQFGSGGTWPAGLQVIRETVADAGLPVAAYSAVDGSGLDVSNRLSCALLMDALDLAGSGGAVAAGFPLAGRTGTLADRFKGNPAEGKLRAKTGSLNFVAGLAGFVDSAGAGTLEFALLANDLPNRIDSGRVLQERVGAALSLYPELPPIAELDPE